MVGLCRQAPPPAPPAWQSADLAGDAGTEYGRFSGRVLPLGAGPLPARAPRYLIEQLAGAGTRLLYRITAVGFGADASTLVVLQAYYRRAGAGPHGRRLGWREIGNWPELHRRAS